MSAPLICVTQRCAVIKILWSIKGAPRTGLLHWDKGHIEICGYSYTDANWVSVMVPWPWIGWHSLDAGEPFFRTMVKTKAGSS
jgi:hypothetical protein